MDRVFESGAVLIPPAAPSSPSTGYPTGGNPVGGVPASKPGAWWFHMITEELRAVIEAAGLTPAHTNLAQVLAALPGALASRPEMARSLASSGHQKLPGGLIMQWGQVAASNSTPVPVTFPIAFPNEAFRMLLGVYSTGGAAWARYGALTLTGTTLAQTTNYSTQGCEWLVFGR